MGLNRLNHHSLKFWGSKYIYYKSDRAEKHNDGQYSAADVKSGLVDDDYAVTRVVNRTRTLAVVLFLLLSWRKEFYGSDRFFWRLVSKVCSEEGFGLLEEI